MDMDSRKNPAAKGESLSAADKESILISPNSVHRNAGTQPLKTRDKRSLLEKSIFAAFDRPWNGFNARGERILWPVSTGGRSDGDDDSRDKWKDCHRNRRHELDNRSHNLIANTPGPIAPAPNPITERTAQAAPMQGGSTSSVIELEWIEESAIEDRL